MTYTVRFTDPKAMLASDEVTPNGDFEFSEIMTGIMGGFVGLTLLANTQNLVKFRSVSDGLGVEFSVTGLNLNASVYGTGYVLQTGTVHKITTSYKLGYGEAYKGYFEVSDLHLSAYSTFNTIRDGASYGTRGADQTILAGEAIRYFGTAANDIFLEHTKGPLGETLTLNGDDYLKLGGGNDQFWADAGNDTLLGENGHDTLRGGDGNDTLNGGWGRDRLYGDAGNDRISGGRMNDVAYGGGGNDVLFGDNGNDRLFGGDGDDRLRGGLHRDTLDGGTGNDTLNGDRGNDVLIGGLGKDVLIGGAGQDRLNGGVYDDILYGGLHKDTLDGSYGADTLVGGKGQDFLTGGKGIDVFVFADGDGHDRITDFKAEDLLKITTVGEITSKTTDIGVRVIWDDGSVLLEGVDDPATVHFWVGG